MRRQDVLIVRLGDALVDATHGIQDESSRAIRGVRDVLINVSRATAGCVHSGGVRRRGRRSEAVIVVGRSVFHSFTSGV